eukprot:2079950-Pyramimonas_sp.AAC.2
MTFMLFRTLGVGTARAAQLLQPLNNQMPSTQQQYDQLLERMRSHGDLAERSPGNTGSIFSGRTSKRNHNLTRPRGQHSTGIWLECWLAIGRQVFTTRRDHPLGSPNQQEDEFSDPGTDTDTVSSIGAENFEWSDQPAGDDAAAQYVQFRYHHAKRRRRLHLNKPVARFRRAARRVFFREDKGRGMGGRRTRRLHGNEMASYLTRLTNRGFEEPFFGGKGRGKGRHRHATGKMKGA